MDHVQLAGQAPLVRPIKRGQHPLLEAARRVMRLHVGGIDSNSAASGSAPSERANPAKSNGQIPRYGACR
ncbi:MAG: hypothetical protein OXF25_07455 [Cyanobacteria bacterium MAG CAR3_bin_5]|nr:hypothetical protein [Cyanobacteria bacterium MAG CAR3_bin_5]MCY4236527.1 hypothetical protein [Cyanobacteria bacterium MAG CAR2_bin_4]